jgi:hypothetical protein
MGSDALATARSLVELFGPVLAVILIGMILLAVVIAGRTILEYGHKAGGMFVPMVKDILLRLLAETKKESKAIKVEITFTIIYALIFFLAFGGLLIHELVASQFHISEKIFNGLIVSCFLVICILNRVSVDLSTRLP